MTTSVLERPAPARDLIALAETWGSCEEDPRPPVAQLAARALALLIGGGVLVAANIGVAVAELFVCARLVAPLLRAVVLLS